ncbi:MAG TPA: DinB family protein [Pirellulales bacterium]
MFLSKGIVVQSKELLQLALSLSFDNALPLIEDMRSAPTTTPLPGGNHTHWLIGHLTFVDSRVLHNLLLNTPNPLEDWKPLFGAKSQPTADVSAYPAFDEILAKCRAGRAELLALLDSLSEEDLDRTPSNVPPGMETRFGSWRKCFLMIALHWSNHRGQVCDNRKAAGRDPMFM